jgi:TBC1 domain family protein 5
MIENKNLLNIPLEVPDPPPMARRQERRRPPFATEGRASNGPQLGHSRHLSSQAASLPEFFARNLMERGENLGLNNIMSAVSELRVSFNHVSPQTLIIYAA